MILKKTLKLPRRWLRAEGREARRERSNGDMAHLCLPRARNVNVVLAVDGAGAAQTKKNRYHCNDDGQRFRHHHARVILAIASVRDVFWR